MQNTTIVTNEQFKNDRKWYVIDATDKILGDLAVTAANILRGKNKVTFTNNFDCGDYLIVKNCDKIKLTGNKLIGKKYYNHSQYLGGLRVRTAKDMIEKYSNEMVYEAIKGMVPKTRLGRQVLTKLTCYKNEGKDHSAQQPIEL